MYKINVKVESNKVDIISQSVPITSKSLNTIKCVFDLPTEYKGLNCVAVFTCIDKTYKEMIVGSECVIPKDVLALDVRVKLGVYAFKGEDLIYSPTPAGFKVEIGSYTEETSEETEANQNAFDKWVEKANELYLKIEKADMDLDKKIAGIEEKIENGELNGKNGVDGKDGTNGRDGIDGKDGVDGQDGFSPTVTVKTNTDEEYILEITNKNGKTETPNLKGKDGLDGKDGINGKDGSNGKNGADGKSAYEISVELGFEGTEQEWIDSLKSEENTKIHYKRGTIDFLSLETLQFFQKIADDYNNKKNIYFIWNKKNETILYGTSTTTENPAKIALYAQKTLKNFETVNYLKRLVVTAPSIIIKLDDSNKVTEVTYNEPTNSEMNVLSKQISELEYDGYFEPMYQNDPVPKGYLDKVVGDINSILDYINGEVIEEEPVTLEAEILIEEDVDNINDEYKEVIDDDE